MMFPAGASVFIEICRFNKDMTQIENKKSYEFRISSNNLKFTIDGGCENPHWKSLLEKNGIEIPESVYLYKDFYAIRLHSWKDS